jgi:hypothetical protein
MNSETVVDNDMEDQIEAMQMVFTNYCDGDGLMTKRDVMNVPYIADLLVSCLIVPFSYAFIPC